MAKLSSRYVAPSLHVFCSPLCRCGVVELSRPPVLVWRVEQLEAPSCHDFVDRTVALKRRDEPDPERRHGWVARRRVGQGGFGCPADREVLRNRDDPPAEQPRGLGLRTQLAPID
jgi:hypothetical protein